MRWIVPLMCLALAGCVPNLGGWERERPDGGRFEPRDGGRDPRVDAGLPLPDCASPIPIGGGYREGFEGGPGGWGITTESDTVLPSWDWGQPAGEQIAGASEGQFAWATGLAAPYVDREESLLVSPCFDASATTNDLLIGVDVAAFTEGTTDRVVLEYSVDGGEWVVATGESRIGWYNGSGWGGERAWERAHTLLPGTAGRSRVQLRFRFHSDGSVIRGDGGAIDDVSLRESSFDLAMTVTQGARCGWAVATVTNVGGLPVTGFEIRTQVDGLSTGSQAYDEQLGFLASEVYEFGGSLAFTTSATVFTVGDEDASNDTASVGHTTEPFGGGYFSDFEADDGGLQRYGEPTSWEWGTPGDELIRSAGSGSRAWMTNLTEDYGTNERGALMLPCWDMSALSRDPQISLMRVFDTESCCDRGRVEVSIDGGEFELLGGAMTGGVNWYSSQGWSGSSGAGLWALAQHPLTGAAGHAAVRVRILFRSDGSVFGEGFGIDDLAVIP